MSDEHHGVSEEDTAPHIVWAQDSSNPEHDETPMPHMADGE
jgi:hypothetical protein